MLSMSWVEVADTANYRIVAETLAAGGHLYRDTSGIYPYPPVWAGFERVALYLSQNSPLPFRLWIEIPGMLGDLGVALLLYKIGQSSLLFASLYLFNPISIAISSMHGQFDSIPVFFLLLACHIFQNLGRPFIAMTSLAAGIAMKSFPVLMLPFFLIQIRTLRKKVIALSLAVGPVICLLFPFYLADSQALARQLFGYGGVADHGWLVAAKAMAALIKPSFIPALLPFGTILGLAAFGACLIIAGIKMSQRVRSGHDLNLYDASALVFTAFFAFYPGISSQYFIWLLPWLIMRDRESAAVYTVLSSLALAAFYAYIWPDILYGPFHPIEAAPSLLVVLYLGFTLLWWLFCFTRLPSIFKKATRVPFRDSRPESNPVHEEA